MYRNRLGVVVLFAIITAMLAAVVPSHPASAQTPAPTATATPSYQFEVPLTDGGTLLVERRITYGEIAVVGAVLLLLVGSVIFWVLRAMRLYIA